MGIKEKIAERNRKLKNTAKLGKKAQPVAKPAMSAKDKAILERVKMFREGKNPDAPKKKKTASREINRVKYYKTGKNE